jgi:GT2 family glycosyltransferase
LRAALRDGLACVVRAGLASGIQPRRLAALEYHLIRIGAPWAFDREHYRQHHADGIASAADTLWHYVRQGAVEGRDPHALIGEERYRKAVGLGVDGLSALGHWLAIGRHRKFDLVPSFKPDCYLKSNQDVRVSGYDPLEHYCLWGWREGRPVGRHPSAEGTHGFAVKLPRTTSPPPVVPLAPALCALPPPRTAAAFVDVVVPVHGGTNETLICLASLLAAPVETPFEIVVVDDATPEPALADALDVLAAAGRITLLRNTTNRGFAAAINRGSALHPHRDVVWLNADTEVYPGWLDRLRAATLAEPDIATATPFTTNGEICGYPRRLMDNPDPLELSWAALDSLAARTNAGIRIDLPTAVGFASYVRRDALEAIGPLDAETFGRGYGEENDFCRRGRALGWRDVLAADVFIRHCGATSFGPEKAARARAANAAIDRLHPGYHAEVRDFIARDPIAPARRALDAARLARLARPRSVLIVGHGRGGGTGRHMRAEAARLHAEGVAVYTLITWPDRSGRAALSHAEAADLPAFEAVDLAQEADALVERLGALGVGEVHLHHLVDFPPDAETAFLHMLDRLGARLEVTIHDYFFVCPRINLVDHSGLYCGEPAAPACEACLARGGAERGARDIRAWRARWANLLRRADCIRAPSRDARQRILRHFPEIEATITVDPHESTIAAPVQPREPRARLRIGAIGAIGPIKGFDVLLACIRAARHANRPIDFVVVGYTANDNEARRAGIVVTGAYREEELDMAIARADLDLLFLPSVCPETFSYTLSAALRSGLPIAAFDLGAIAERLREAGQGTLIPLRRAVEPLALLDTLQAAAWPMRPRYSPLEHEEMHT